MRPGGGGRVETRVPQKISGVYLFLAVRYWEVQCPIIFAPALLLGCKQKAVWVYKRTNVRKNARKPERNVKLLGRYFSGVGPQKCPTASQNMLHICCDNVSHNRSSR